MFLLILYLVYTIVQLYSDLTMLTLHARTYLICDIKPDMKLIQISYGIYHKFAISVIIYNILCLL